MTVFLDFSEAIDTLNQFIMLRKLNLCDIRITKNNWFESYLGNWYHYVKIEGTCSYHLPVSHGVPQGLILGPILFLVYMNNMTYLYSNS